MVRGHKDVSGGCRRAASWATAWGPTGQPPDTTLIQPVRSPRAAQSRQQAPRSLKHFNTEACGCSSWRAAPSTRQWRGSPAGAPGRLTSQPRAWLRVCPYHSSSCSRVLPSPLLWWLLAAPPATAARRCGPGQLAESWETERQGRRRCSGTRGQRPSWYPVLPPGWGWPAVPPPTPPLGPRTCSSPAGGVWAISLQGLHWASGCEPRPHGQRGHPGHPQAVGGPLAKPRGEQLGRIALGSHPYQGAVS